MDATHLFSLGPHAPPAGRNGTGAQGQQAELATFVSALAWGGARPSLPAWGGARSLLHLPRCRLQVQQLLGSLVGLKAVSRPPAMLQYQMPQS